MTTEYPWTRSYPAWLSWDEPLPKPRRAEDFLRMAARQWPERTAMVFDGKRTTYAQLYSLAQSCAIGLKAKGVGPGVNVAIHLPNLLHYPVCVFAVWMAGGTVVNLSISSPEETLRWQIDDSEASLIVTMDRAPTLDLFLSLVAKGRLRSVIACAAGDFEMGATRERGQRDNGDGIVRLAELLLNEGAGGVLHEAPTQDVAVLQYTGGSTGDLKAAMLSHANFSAIIHINDLWNRQFDVPVHRVATTLPLSHIYGFTVLIRSVGSGATMFFYDALQIQRMLDDIAGNEITMMYGVPATFGAIVGFSNLEHYDLGSLVQCASGGAPLPDAVRNRFTERTGMPLAQGYALTETTSLAVREFAGFRKAGAVGLPTPHTMVEIVDVETGTRLLATGETGEICIRGPQVMSGYWKREALSAEALNDGRLHTGDIGYLSEDGYLTIMDRKKDVVFVGGYNVFPSKVEEALYKYEGVSEAVVVPVPDGTLGMQLKAFLAVRGPGEPDIRDLRRFLAKYLAYYEIPASYEIRPVLPKTASGKLSRHLLARELAQRKRASRLHPR